MLFTSKAKGFLQKQPQRFLGKKVRRLSLSPALKSAPYLSRVLVYIGIVVVLISITQYQFSFLSFIKEPLLDASVPVFNFFSKPFDYAHQLMHRMADFRKIYEQGQLLYRFEEERDYWQAKTDALMRQNEELAQFVKFISLEGQGSFPEIKATVRVIANPGGIYYHNLILEGGKEQGIEIGETVVTDQGLVGRITEAGKNASRVLLITDIEARVPVYLENSGVQAILAGDSEKLPYLLRIQEDPLKPSPQVGERVLTSNQGGGAFPFGIPVGILEADKESPDVLRVRPFVDFNRLYYVGILKSIQPLIDEATLPKEKESDF